MAGAERGEAHQAYLGQRTFPSLDGLRCVAILAVLWHHSGEFSARYEGLQHRGEQGVGLFFVISGFLITTLLLRERQAFGAISLRRFYARRALRIFPLYYAVLALYAVLVRLVERGSPEGQAFFANLPAFLTYTSNWILPEDPQERVIFHFAWSLATEEQFYLVWPWIVVGFAPRRAGPIAAALALIAVREAVALGRLTGALPRDVLVFRVLDSISTKILLGCLGAYALHRAASFRAVSFVLGRRPAAPLCLVLLLLWLPRRPGPATDLVTSVAMTALVLACCIRPDHGLRPLLGWGPIRYVGTISYGIYLLHMLALGVVRRTPGVRGALMTFVTASALAVAAATVSYYAFERPILRYKDRLSPLKTLR